MLFAVSFRAFCLMSYCIRVLGVVGGVVGGCRVCDGGVRHIESQACVNTVSCWFQSFLSIGDL